MANNIKEIYASVEKSDKVLSNIITGNGCLDINSYSLYVGSGADGTCSIVFKNNGVISVKSTTTFNATCTYFDGSTGTKTFTANVVTDISNVLTLKVSLSRNSSNGSGSASMGGFVIVEALHDIGLTLEGFSLYVGSGADGTCSATIRNDGCSIIQYSKNATLKATYKDGTTGNISVTTNTNINIANVSKFTIGLSRNSSGGSGSSSGGAFTVIS